MFDHVAFEMTCPKCGNLMKDFQSKDGPCSLGIVSVSEICNLYDRCSKCNTHVEFIRKTNDKMMPKLKQVLKEFDMMVDEKKWMPKNI